MLDIEETLSRELREVADGLHVPAMPALQQESPRVSRHWQALLVAVAVLAIVGVVAVALNALDDGTPDPAVPTPVPSRAETPGPIPRTAPTIPYVLDQKLYVDGEQVPGTWWYLETGGGVWLAMRADDNSWWWGRGPQPNRIETTVDSPPVLSSNGRYVGALGAEGGGVVTAVQTSDGQALGSTPVDLGDPADGSAVHIRAVTDDGKVIVQGTQTSVLWQVTGHGTNDMTQTAPGQTVLTGTPAGLVITSGDESVQYLAEISEIGALTRTGELPPLDSIAVSPGAVSMVWTPLGTLGGEVTSVPTLKVGTVDGTQQATLEAPDGREFRVQEWAWEDDDYLIAPVTPDPNARGLPDNRVARCSAQTAQCVLIRP